MTEIMKIFTAICWILYDEFVLFGHENVGNIGLKEKCEKSKKSCLFYFTNKL